jgi:Ca2+-binding RTX toxin-like protein
MLLTTALLLVALAVPASSLAVGGLVVTGGEYLSVDDIAGDGNRLVVTGTGGTYLVTDTAVAPTAGAGCTATANPATLSCTSSLRALRTTGSNPTGTDVVDLSATDLEADWDHTGSGALTFRCGARRCYASGGDGADTLVGGARIDSLYGEGGKDIVSGGAGRDYLSGGDGDDSLTGGADADRFFGGNGNDSLDGGAGADSFTCESGIDVYVGGTGRDLFSCANNGDPLTITLDGVANDGEVGDTDNVGTDIENVTGGSESDVIIGNDSRNELSGGEGDDVIDGLAGQDVLNGDVGNDTLRAGAGNDKLVGGAGADDLVGGDGFDRTSYEETNTQQVYLDRTRSGRGDFAPNNSSVDIDGPVNVSLDGAANDGPSGEGDNVKVEGVTGTPFADTFSGNAQANHFDGGNGDDRLFGFGGNDLLEGGDGDDTIVGGEGSDELRGEAGDDQLNARDRSTDVLNCGAGDDSATVNRSGDTTWRTCERVIGLAVPR